MPFFLLLVAAIMFLAAYRETQGDLGNLLAEDVPGFLKWALAIVAIGSLGMVPQLRQVSRYLLALVFIVLVVTQYRALLVGITGLDTGTQPAVTPATDPATAYALNPVNPAVTAGGISGTSTDAGGGGSLPDQPQTVLGASTAAASAAGFDPQAYLSDIEHQLSTASGLGFLIGA